MVEIAGATAVEFHLTASAHLQRAAAVLPPCIIRPCPQQYLTSLSAGPACSVGFIAIQVVAVAASISAHIFPDASTAITTACTAAVDAVTVTVGGAATSATSVSNSAFAVAVVVAAAAADTAATAATIAAAADLITVHCTSGTQAIASAT